jgi:hypothetical protein
MIVAVVHGTRILAALRPEDEPGTTNIVLQAEARKHRLGLAFT